METTITNRFRRTFISLAAAVAVAVPGIASAGFGDRVQAVKTRTNLHITNVRENRPVRSAVSEAKEPAAEIFQQVKDMQVMEQFRQSMGLMKEMQADYVHFTGGEGCNANCATFRTRFKNIFNDFSVLVDEVPALSGNDNLKANIRRMSNLVDHMPPRALYLMWQATSSRLTEMESMADEIRQALVNLPPLMRHSTRGAPQTSADTRSAGSGSGSGLCAWSDQDDKPYVELIQARLEQLGWTFEKLAGIIPDLMVRGEAGVSAGAAVTNGEASAAVGMKPSDSMKISLKVLAAVPQEINWIIRINLLRARAYCS